MEENNYEPNGIKFYANKREMMIVDKNEEQYAGWLLFKHPDGQWVTLRKATEDDMGKLNTCGI